MESNYEDGLKRVVDALYPLPQEDWDAFSRLWSSIHFKRKQTVTVAGNREPYLYFVVAGVQRVYYFDNRGREATLVFTYAPSFGGVVDAFLLQQPSRYNYEILTESRFLRAPFSALQHLINTSQPVEALILKALALSLSGLLERLVELQCFSSEEKFRKLLQRSPHILQMVPHKYLANYLGINATNFSKLINNVRI